MSNVQVEAVREYYRCAFRPNDPELTVADVLDFVDYLQMFYTGPDAIYRYDFTFAEICEGKLKTEGIDLPHSKSFNISPAERNTTVVRKKSNNNHNNNKKKKRRF